MKRWMETVNNTWEVEHFCHLIRTTRIIIRLLRKCLPGARQTLPSYLRSEKWTNRDIHPQRELFLFHQHVGSSRVCLSPAPIRFHSRGWHWCEVRIICRLSHVLLQERPLIEHRVQFHSIEFILEYREWVVSFKSETSLCNGVESTSHVLEEWWFTWISIRVLAPTISWIEIKISSERQTSECEFSSDPLVKCCRAAFLPLLSSFNVRALLNTYGAAMLVSGGVATANSAKGVTGNRVV